MSVDHEAVQIALYDVLAGGGFGLPILWAGVDYGAMPDEFLSTQIIRARGTAESYTTGRFVGEFVVTHKIKGGGGTTHGTAIATDIADTFNAAGPHLSYSGGVINMSSPATPLGPLPSAEWIETPCAIPFWVLG